MPYIVKEDRRVLNDSVYELSNIVCDEGQLNYCITKLLHLYLEREGLCYKNINKLIGVLECAKLELYAMIARPYEDIKRSENGPVSNLDKK